MRSSTSSAATPYSLSESERDDADDADDADDDEDDDADCPWTDICSGDKRKTLSW